MPSAEKDGRPALLQHQGLHLRELQALGATVPMSLFGEEDSRECCALCHRVFPDYRAWSVHAFSTHGRTDEVRRLTTGSQCPSCLKHFASAVKLGRHLKYSAACRSHLLATGRRNAPEPGVGSRKAPDDGLLLMPTQQAEGPHPRLEARFIDDEEERPSAEVLDCLAHLDYDGSLAQLGHAAFWDRIRVSFSCVCLQASRLRVYCDLLARVCLRLRRCCRLFHSRPPTEMLRTGSAGRISSLGLRQILTHSAQPRTPSSIAASTSPCWNAMRPASRHRSCQVRMTFLYRLETCPMNLPSTSQAIGSSHIHEQIPWLLCETGALSISLTMSTRSAAT